MGTVCGSLAKKNSVVSAVDTGKRLGSKTNAVAQTQYSISTSILCSPIWNPFHISRDEAEALLQNAFSGAFVFSHSLASEIFLSVSTGKYVCHHPVLKYSQQYEIGGRTFSNIETAIMFYRNNALGDAVLTEQYNPLTIRASSSRTELLVPKTPSAPSSSSTPNTKRVTFESVSKPSQHTSTSLAEEPITSEAISPKTTRTTTVAESDASVHDQHEQELFKKLQNKPRKSICRIQPEDSLSTSSENMFREEQI